MVNFAPPKPSSFNNLEKYTAMQRLLILALFLACSSSLYAQYEWAPLGATWTFNQGFSVDDFSPNPIDEVAWKYDITATADTIWNGMPARIVGSHIHVQDGYKVYYVWDDALRLLYDFSLEAGDTVQFELLYCTCELVPAAYVVDSVAVDIVDGLPLKRVHTRRADDLAFEAMLEYSFQEKVGQLPTHLQWGGTMHGCYTPVDYGPAYLRCYNDQEIHLTTDAFALFSGGLNCNYTNPDLPAPAGASGCNYLPVNTTELAAPAPWMRLYPNPAHQAINLELEPRSESVHFSLYHLSGIQAGQWLIPAGTSSQHIQLPELPSGLYIWTLRGDGLLQSGKVLVE
jgi:hypothetical protein